MNDKPNIAIGLLGSVLDWGKRKTRWNKWRPTVALCMHEDLPIHRLELLVQKKFIELGNQVVEDIQEISPQTQVRLHEVVMEDPWDFEEVYGSLHDFARSYPFEPETTNYLIHITTGTHVAQTCMFLLTESHHFPAKLIQVSPPLRTQDEDRIKGKYRVIDLDLSKYDRIASRFQAEQQESLSFLKSGIETLNPEFNALIERIESVAMESKAPILLIGPTGAGKSKLAKRIFELKKVRRQITGNFVEVNCATLRGDASMSALFGHKKGAFTGALQDRAGLLRAAHNGILFLDEIGELGVDEQAMLLRAIEEKTFLPMGSDQETSSDFQLIAGTNRNLSKDVQTGRFREDLLARINLWTFYLPGLRERPEDIAPNLDYELEQLSQQTGKHATFNKEAKERFLRFAVSGAALWKANFRDLNAAVVRLGTLARGGRITTELVEEEIERLRLSWNPTQNTGSKSIDLDRWLSSEDLEQLDLFDQIQLKAVLEVCLQSNTLAEAGRQLFSVSRKQQKNTNDSDRLRKYLKRFGLQWSELRRRKTPQRPY